MNSPAIEADGLKKTFGKVAALDGLSFQAPTGSVLRALARCPGVLRRGAARPRRAWLRPDEPVTRKESP